MLTAKRRPKGEKCNQFSMRLSSENYDRVISYARYGEEEPLSLSLAMEKLAMRGYAAMGLDENPPTRDKFIMNGEG